MRNKMKHHAVKKNKHPQTIHDVFFDSLLKNEPTTYK
jgi:hypothetical protein